MMKVEKMTSSRSGREVANQFIIRDDTRIVFQSYDSTIAIIDNSKKGAARLTLGRDWDYSVTTMKYLYQFLYQFLGWSVNKKAIEKAIDNKDICYDSCLA